MTTQPLSRVSSEPRVTISKWPELPRTNKLVLYSEASLMRKPSRGAASRRGWLEVIQHRWDIFMDGLDRFGYVYEHMHPVPSLAFDCTWIPAGGPVTHSVRGALCEEARRAFEMSQKMNGTTFGSQCSIGKFSGRFPSTKSFHCEVQNHGLCIQGKKHKSGHMPEAVLLLLALFCDYFLDWLMFSFFVKLY